jgi:hypothetical protein
MLWVPMAASPLPAAANSSRKAWSILASLATIRPPDRGQEIPGVEKDVTGGIGVDDASIRFDKAHPRAEAIKCAGEVRGIRGLQIDMPADQYGPADVRNDEAHAPARFIVDNTLALIAKHPEQGRGGRRFIEHRRYVIHHALRVAPLLVKPAFPGIPGKA